MPPCGCGRDRGRRARVLYGVFSMMLILRCRRQRPHAGDRRRGAGRRQAYLNRQYSTILVVGVMLFA